LIEAPQPEDVKYITTMQFPASYVINGQKFGDQFKIYLTDKYLVVYLDANVVRFVAEILSYEKVSYKQYVVQTPEGEVIVSREENCGCGNSLRGFHPYQGIPHIAHYPSLKGT
jgi:hypothetical protein